MTVPPSRTSMSTPLRIAISTCPNDTFTFHGLMSGDVPTDEVSVQFHLADVQELNEGVRDGRFDVAKVSFRAALAHSKDYWVLPVGAALGFGNGPLLLSRDEGRVPGPGDRVLGPGSATTADLLFRMFHGTSGARVEQALFSEIMPALHAGKADFGVCIHEGRFTYRQEGLFLVEDLGKRWEEETGCPLPLGGLVARKSLGVPFLERIVGWLRTSLDLALGDPEAALPTMRRYAQSLSDEVIRAHVELYVNDNTRELGAAGREALRVFAERAQLLCGSPSADPLVVFTPR